MSFGSEIFKLGVEISALDHFTRPMREVQRSMSQSQKEIENLTKALGSMGKTDGEIRRLTDDLQRLQRASDFSKMANDLKKVGMNAKEIDKVKSSYDQVIKAQQEHQKQTERIQKLSDKGVKLTAYGMGVTGASIATAQGMTEWLKEAGEFQSQLTLIRDITGSSDKQMQNLGNTIMDVSTKVSRFNDMDLTGFAQQLASGGFSNPKDIQNLLLPVAQFAEVQDYAHKASPEEAVQSAIEMAHLFKHYDQGSFYKYLDTFNRYSMMQPGSSKDLEQTLTYLAPTASRQFHMPESDVMTLSALANVVGLRGSHGGTNAADMVMRLVPGLTGMPDAKKTPKAWEAMEKLGFIDSKGKSAFFDSKGQLAPLDKILDKLIDVSKRYKPADLAKYYHDIFGIQGGRAAAILGDPTTLEQLEKARKQLGKMKGMEATNADLQNTTAGKLKMFDSNKMTLMIRLANQLSKALDPVLDDINKILDKTLKFTEAHPKVAKMAAEFGGLAVGVGLVLGPLATLAGGIMTVVGNWKLVKRAANEATLAEEAAAGAAGGAGAAGSKMSALKTAAGATAGFFGLDYLGGWGKDLANKAADSVFGKDSGNFDAWAQHKQAIEKAAGSPMKHAMGGIFTQPHLGLLAEAGPEAYIPLSNRKRGLQVWQQAGQALGVGTGGAPVIINIYAQPNHDEEAIANKVVNKLGKLSRGMNMNTGMRINLGSV